MNGSSLSLRRPDDMLIADLRLFNLEVSPDGTSLIVPGPGEAVAELSLPAQHLAEPAFDDTKPVPWVVPLVGGPSTQLRFAAPPGSSSFPIGAGGILDVIVQWPASGLVEVLSTLRVAAPSRWRFSAAPEPWPAASGPVSLGLDEGVVQLQEPEVRRPLWTARPAGTVLDLWGEALHPYTSFTLPFYGDPGGSPLTAQHQGTVVGPPPVAAYWRVSRMLLTPLGGTTEVTGPLSAADSTPAMSFAQRTSVGRDAYARHVTAGHLSSGHAATLTTVTERVIRTAPIGSRIAGEPPQPTTTGSMASTTTLSVSEPWVDLNAERVDADPMLRVSAFRGLRLEVGSRPVDTSQLGSMDWITESGGRPVMFDLVATDHGGNTVHLAMPLAFIPAGTDPAAAKAFVSSGTGPRPVMPTQAVTVAGDPHGEGRTTVEVVGLDPSPAVAASRPVVPSFNRMTIVIDALEGLAGTLPVADFRFHGLFAAAGGFDPLQNPHGAFLERVGGTDAADVSGATAGGLANPRFTVGALSTEAGAVAGELVDAAVPDIAAVRRAFGDATLFGGLALADLLADDPFDRVDGRAVIPGAVRRRLPDGDDTSYTFSATLRPDPPAPAVTSPLSTVTLTTTQRRGTDGSLTASTHGRVTDVGFTLAGVVTLRFAEVWFRSEAGATDFDVAGVSIEFGDALEYVATLAEELGKLGQGSGVRVDVDGSGVTAGFGLAIPNVTAGVVQFSNLTVDSWLRLPFDGSPLCFSLDIANRQRPFLATVAVFGGGGWFSLRATPSQLVTLELGVEFGGSMSLDIIVASGGITVVAGIHIALGTGATPLNVDAYLRASGFLSVLGVVTIFVEFRLALGFRKKAIDGVMHAVFAGAASVTVGIEVLFFSRSVTLEFSRELLGAPADPGFSDCFDLDDWDEYCEAFAA